MHTRHRNICPPIGGRFEGLRNSASLKVVTSSGLQPKTKMRIAVPVRMTFPQSGIGVDRQTDTQTSSL